MHEPRGKCTCCGKLEPEGGWPHAGFGGGDITDLSLWEFYCSDACFVHHTDGDCMCFQEEDGDDLDDDWC